MENWNNFVDELKEYFNSQTEEEKEKEWQRKTIQNKRMTHDILVHPFFLFIISMNKE